ncbi:MAG: hypothetical protein KDA53_10880 [Hyphomonas sp.]|nr:hypothetical protein [Hyphomonas sp.]
MLFKMILDAASDDERPIARGFLKHLIAGFGIGLLVGAVLILLMLFLLGNLDLHVPVVFIAAMLLQFGPIGGLVGVGIYVTRVTDRSKPGDDDDDEPRGGTKAPVTSAPARLRPARQAPKASPVPSPA